MARSFDRTELKQYLDKFAGKRVLVIGDLMLDHYIWGSVKRISPEAPVPVVDVLSESVLLGGAGNVAHNIRTLGGEAFLCGVLGNDDAGRRLIRELKLIGVGLSGVVLEEERPTTQKTRIVAHQQHVVRYDHEKVINLLPKTEKKIIDMITEEMTRIHCAVVSDYAKGMITEGLLRAILPRLIRRGIPVIVDPKIKHFSLYKKVTLVTPNHLEASQAAGVEIVDESTLNLAGRTILNKLQCRAVLITRGEHGMSLFEKGGGVTHIPAEAKEVYDVTGAGDTVVGTLALSLSAGASLVDSTRLANVAAGEVVGMVGTAAIKKDLLEKALS